MKKDRSGMNSSCGLTASLGQRGRLMFATRQTRLHRKPRNGARLPSTDFRMSSRKLAKISLVLGLWWVSPPAFAYVDPGTGAMLVQAILALIAAAIFYFRNPRQLWHDLRNWWKKSRKS